MRIHVLMDNNAPEGLVCEWGFAVLIEHAGKRILLDAGASPAFAQNARELGVPIDDVDCAVLSHAHFDHADGMPAFFEANRNARLFVREGAAENCYDLKEGENHYIGIARGMLSQYASRIEYVRGVYELFPGAWLVPHSTPGLQSEGARQNMLIMRDGTLEPDDFSHEQSLVLETPEGLVVFNSCSHGGADAIITEITDSFPGKRVRALIGGLHLFLDEPDRVRALAQRVKALDIELLLTGHCTGDAAFAILREELGDVSQQFQVGLSIEL